MAYEDTRFRGGAGFRDDPDDPGVPPVDNTSSYGGGGFPGLSGYGAGSTGDQTDSTLRRTPSAAQLEDVFDDPEHGDPGRDRMGVHLIWELVLLLAAGAFGFLLFQGHRASVSGDALRGLMISATVLGFLALGMGLSLRAAAPNLAVGPIAYGSGLFFVTHADRGLLPAALMTAVLAAGAGLAIAVVVTGFHVPAWAASLGAGVGVVVWIQMHGAAVTLPKGTYQPAKHALYWLAGFAVLALVGSLLGVSKGVRRSVARFRPISDPARRRGATGGIIAALAIIGSSLLAGAAGVLYALNLRSLAPPEPSAVFTAMALGVALLAGTSAFGRRGGIFGTILAVALVSLVTQYAAVTHRNVAPLAIAAAAIGIGLVATRLVETFGRPALAAEPENEWAGATTPADDGPADTGWTPSRSGWTTTQSGSDERWVTEDRWGTR
jgi:ribose/xylose/arabinose/galactoside ABC-type transport system permease subunit